MLFRSMTDQLPPLTYTAADVGARLQYPARRVHDMWRRGELPAPIDVSLPAVSLRWSPVVIDRYINPPQEAPR